MSAPHALEPGTRLVDRYRLDEQIGRAEDTTYWRAQDELLDRAVGVCLLQGDDAGAQRVLGAARRAAAVTDPRFLRVLDANETDGVVYVVSEWVSATNLAALLKGRVLPADQARDLALEVAGALEAAHQEGLAHLCLTPEHVLRTSHGQIKVAGLAVDAAVHGLSGADGAEAAARDTRGVAALLYAALTGRWPGAEPSEVAPAPHDAGRLCSPRQVKAGVPDDLDTLIAVTLDAGPRHHSHDDPGPARTPGELSRRLTATLATSKIPVVRPPADAEGDTPPPYRNGPYIATYDEEGPRRGRLAGRAAYVLVGLVLLVGLGLAGWQLATTGLGGVGGRSTSGATTSPSTTSAAQAKPLTVAGAVGFDPEGDGEENTDRADRAIDGDPATAWTTKTYFQQLGPGGIKKGVGLLLDLGSRQDVASVTVHVDGEPARLQVRLGDNAGTQLADFERAAEVTGRGGTATARLASPQRARYVLLWFTELPQQGASAFKASISEVTVRG
ncbi:MAG: hypothetical protein QOI54_1608 [Actinomycetota bacterium]|nr:hypothetical protein [Actinomycetota bacterium]